MTDRGLVSIITPSWNCGQFVEETIKSIQGQIYTNWELLFQDDCSTDDTKRIIEKFAANDSRIKYECNRQNSGAAITRNNALRRAKGKWIAFLDSDDLWLPDKLEQQIKFMEDNGYDFTYHEYTEMTEDGVDNGIYVSGIERVNKLGMYACCWPGCLSVMYNRYKIGLIQINDVRKNNDTAIWLKVIHKAPCYLLKKNLARYRRRKGSITPSSLWSRIWAHYPLFRIAENMNPLAAAFFTLLNVCGNAYKKLFYIKRIAK